MYVHQFFKLINENRQSETESQGMMQRLAGIMGRSSEKGFYYNIAGTDFTIADIKHGMLRGNKPMPGHLLRVLSGSDAKLNILPNVSDSPSQPLNVSFV